MIRLEPVTERTFGRILDMKLSAEQNRFVAPNVVSMAQAWLYYAEARPFAVCDVEDVVGFLMLDWDEGERNAGVWRFMIAPEHQRKGYGRAALQAAIDLVRGAGCFDLMNLDFVPGNTVARELYASLGFRENGEVEDGEIVMVLPLTEHPRVGMTVADGDDLNELNALIASEAAKGAVIPASFADKSALAQAVSNKRVKRLTLMGKAIGLACGDALLLSRAHAERLAEARERVGLHP